MSTDLPASAEIVIIGGGVVGCSVAYHLTQMGKRDVVLARAGAALLRHDLACRRARRPAARAPEHDAARAALDRALFAPRGRDRPCHRLEAVRLDHRRAHARAHDAAAPGRRLRDGAGRPLRRHIGQGGGRALSDHGDQRPPRRVMASERRQGEPGRRDAGAGEGRPHARREDLREDQGHGHQREGRPRDRRRDRRGPDRGRRRRELRRAMGKGRRAHVRRHRAAAFGRAHVHRHGPDPGRAPGPAGDARPRRLHLRQGRGRRPSRRRLRAGGEAVGDRRHPGAVRVPAPARRLGPVPDPDGERADPPARPAHRRDQELRQRPGELHAGQQLHHRRGAGAEELLRRGRLQLDRHRERRRRRPGARRVDRRRRADARPVAGRHPALRPLQRQRRLAAVARRRGARAALHDAVAEPRARIGAAVPALAALRPARREGRRVRLEDGLGAAELLRPQRAASALSAIPSGARTGSTPSRPSSAPHARASRSST